jgi:hypothetical protein
MSKVVKRLLLAVILLALLFGFSPISHVLLRTVDGSFAPSPYSSLALIRPSDAATGVRSGVPVPVRITNKTGHTKTYHWVARQGSRLVSLGEKVVRTGHTATILVPSQGAVAGGMQISLNANGVFVTVPILKPRR